MMKILFLVLLYVFVYPKNVHVELKGTWKRPTFTQEARFVVWFFTQFFFSEFFNSVDYLSFWSLLDNPIEFSSSEQEFQLLRELLREEDHKTFEYALSINYYSPLISTFQRLGENVINEHRDLVESQNIHEFVNCNGEIFTDSETLVEYFSKNPKKNENYNFVKYSFDHVRNVIFNENFITCTLYGVINSPLTNTFHSHLRQMENINYLFRHYHVMDVKRKDHFTSKNHADLISLQGYGIELQIKNLEYRTMDPKARPKAMAPNEFGGIHFDELIKKNPKLDYQLNLFRQELIEEAKKIDAPKVWEIQDLGVQVASHIMNSTGNKLNNLLSISQNFPSIMNDVKEWRVSSHVKDEIIHNHKYINEGESKIFMNGSPLDLESTSIFALYDKIKSQSSFYRKLNTYKMSPEDVNSIIDITKSTGVLPRFNLFPNEHIHWLNDLENDKLYSQMPRNVGVILSLNYWGRIQFAKKNMFNYIVMLDPTSEEGIVAIIDVLQMYGNRVPFRFGLVFVPTKQQKKYEKMVNVDVGITGEQETIEINTNEKYDNEEVFKMAVSMFNFVYGQGNPKEAADLFVMLRVHTENGQKITKEHLEKEFNRHASKYGKSFADVIEEKSEHHEYATKLLEFAKKSNFPESPSVFLNGKLFPGSEAKKLFQAGFQSEHEEMQKLVKAKVLTDRSKNMYEDILNEFNAFTDYSSKVFNSPSSMVEVDPFSMKNLKNKFHSFYNDDDNDNISGKFNNAIVCMDMNKDTTIMNVKKLLSIVMKDNNRRLSFLYHSNGIINEAAKKFFSMINTSPNILNDIENFQKFKVQEGTNEIMNEQSKWCSQYSSNEFVIVSGRILKDDNIINDINEIDFELMEQYHDDISSKLCASLERIYLQQEDEMDLLLPKEDIFMGLNTLILSNLNPTTEDEFPILSGSHAKITMNEDIAGPKIQGWINPLSKEGGKCSSYLKLFCSFFKYPCEIYLNPKGSIGEIPIQSWFRYVLHPSLSFDEGERIETNVAYFKDIPSTYILTTYTDEPETWLLESTYAVYDLDNINLDHVDETLYARYQLEHIVVTGSCLDETMREHPRGLQFVLTANGEERKDTLVMANLGYFQLKANPNVFDLNLADGRHSELYKFSKIAYESGEGKGAVKYENIEGKVNIPVHVIHFDGPVLDLKLKRIEGKEKEELLVKDDNLKKKKGIWKSIFGDNKKKIDEKETINVFSVASGHLYERLLKIMMRSVMRTTKESNVKFWILKNYLSPQFKEFIPHMAKKYNFEVEMVTYKWPTWLFKQTNKIRIIWAYKVLFLDVLFPIDVQKIIYVDSDQTTRADLTELWNIDMQGKAVAYTPFCDDKPEMDGYAFWKGGYWKTHLKGKKYHISALYVVDVETFRRTYAGDQYRVIYDNLAKDPNSLSNLDQDLPNFAQHMIPIRSLPMEWLWCETWCNQERKKYVKTIDLCNNPQTKEHKVDQARRIMNVNNEWDFNWSDLDDEIGKFTNEIYEEYGIEAK